MLAIRHTVCVLLVLPLLLGGCGGDGADDGDKPRPPAGGGVILRLKVAAGESGMRWDWSGEPRALVNGVARTVGFDADGVPVVGADVSADGLYTVHFPADAYSRAKRAFVLPPAQFPVSGGSLQAAACPMYGTVRTTGDAADVTLSPLCGVVRIPLAGDAHIASVRVEDRSGGAVSGLFPFDPATPEIVRNGNFGNLPWVVLDCAGTGGGVRPAASGTEFCVAVPAGDYASGLSVRVTDCAHRSATWDIPGPCAVAAGGVKTLAPLNYAPGEDLLFAEHFDNCVWGCDYAAETGGYGVGAGSSVPSPATSAGTEAAYVAKGAGTPGSALFETSDYNSAPAASATLAVRRDYLRNRGLYDWQRLFYAAEYRGCLCGGDVGGYGNRGILVTPRMAAAGEPCCAELSFRICLERGMESDVACMAESGVLLGCEVDGMPVDVDVATGTDISQSVQGVTRTAVLLRAAKLTSGVWHQVRMSFGAVAAGSAFRFMPTVIRDVKNCFWIDDVEVRRTGRYAHAGDCVTVEPTTELAAAVDEANALGSHRHEVRIAFDTGHANLYLTREQPGKTVVDWLRTAGARIGQLHIHGNRGWNGRINDDHLMPGYAGRLGYADAIGRAGLWGEFYHTLLAECRYRGPFTYEISTRTFGTVAGEERSDNVSAPWTIAHNYDTYLYPAFREYANRK